MVKLAWILLLIAIAGVGTIGVLVRASSVRVRKEISPHTIRRLVDVPAEAWARLSQKTIFFGHQSVGKNIIDGVRNLTESDKSVSLNIVETKDAKTIVSPMFVHATVGRNRSPESKIAEFKELMENGFGEKVDIAFFKFCYVDMGKDSNPEAILAAYCEAMDSLKTRFPEVVFVHVTVPLRAPYRRRAVMAAMDRLLDRSVELQDNEIRERYNALLRERVSGKEPLFDLALYETLDPQGLRHYSMKDGQEIPLLVHLYTDDGGHLNAVGRRHVAEQLLISLLDLTRSSP